METDFEEVYSTTVNGLIPVRKYKSKHSPLRVVIADVDGPIVSGFFCLATEAHDDDGLPHTLEHLVFMGSDSYPYKGILDMVANRCLGTGTNAWTDVDHTCYTIKTAGSEGFLVLLPIYVDHILNPLLTDSAFLTEVHHVNEEGEDSGVVYSEMQGVECDGENQINVAMLRAIYPGRCGYKSNTGGVLKSIRENTTNERIKSYHKDYYQPENLVLVITGRIRAEDVFRVLRPVEEAIAAKSAKNLSNNKKPFPRPWQEPVPPFVSSVKQVVPYPSDEEEKGMVYLAWRGPSSIYQLYDITALMMLMEYLTDTAISLLQKTFVETSEPLASKVHYSFIENSESVVYLAFDNVPVSKLDEIQPRLLKVLEPLGNGVERIDMDRMKLVIRRRMLEQQSHLESNPHSTVAFMVIGDVLHGRSNEDFRRRLNPLQDLRALLKESPSFWSDLVMRYLIDRPSVLTEGIPSIKEMETYSVKEQERIEEKRKELGPKGLATQGEIISKALAENDKQPPAELLRSFPIPDISSISHHPIKRYSNRGELAGTSCDRFPLDQIPLRFQLDDVNTEFIYLYALMDTSRVSADQRLYLPLLMACLLESAVMRDGKLIPYESVVAQLSGDTVKTHSAIGIDASSGKHFFCGSFCSAAVLMLQLEREKYTVGVAWMRDLLRRTVFEAERVKVIASKMVNKVPEIKRKGHKMTQMLLRSLLFSEDSNHSLCSLIRQQRFLQSVISDLGKTPDTILKKLTELRDSITRPESLAFHMAAHVDKLPDVPVEAWKTQMFADWDLDAKTTSDGLIELIPDHQLVREVSQGIPMGAALSLGAVESSFVLMAVRSIDDIHHPDLAALLVALQYLDQLEGPFWRTLRAQGLIYCSSLNLKVSEGLIYLLLFKAAHPVLAYKEARSILESHGKTTSGSEDVWETCLFESAKSCLIFDLVEKEGTVFDTVNQSIRAHLSDIPTDYNRQLIQKVAAVTLEQAKRAYRLHAAALLDTDHCRCAIVCHPSKLDEVVEGFNVLGQPVQGYTSVDDSPLSQFCGKKPV